MSSFLDPKSSLDFDINRQQPPPPGRDAESLNRRKNNVHGERESSLTTFPRPESTNRWSFQSALLFICITAFLISIYSYDPSHSRRPASQDTFSTVCFPTSKCLLRLYLPTVLINPPVIVFVISVLGFFTLVFVFHGIRRADRYQDRIMAFGVAGGSILCGYLAFREESVSAFKNVMPAVITASLAASAMIHTFLEKWVNA